jgi:hypothetical protein
MIHSSVCKSPDSPSPFLSNAFRESRRMIYDRAISQFGRKFREMILNSSALSLMVMNLYYIEK